jgi:hypothetical protein
MVIPTVFYYIGRVRQALKSASFAESYRTYLSIREKAGEDLLLADTFPDKRSLFCVTIGPHDRL